MERRINVNQNENENRNGKFGKYFEKNAVRLEAVSREEQDDACEQASRLAEWRLWGRKHRSIHSEMALGMPAVPYYVGEAV